MFAIRLTYFSRSQIDHGGRSTLHELGTILEASTRNNNEFGLTGALVFDERWFLQTLEGKRTAVWNTFRRIEADERHSDVTVVDARNIHERIFGSWWLAFLQSGDEYENIGNFLKDGNFNPSEMTSGQVLELMIRLSKIGTSRRLAPLFSERLKESAHIHSYE
jgi:hypothetical protein